MSGRKYTIGKRLGAGDNAVVYKITDDVTKQEFAFTRYNDDYTTEWRGNFLVLSRARHSLPLLNMPLLVNKAENYKISPIMTGNTVWKESADHNAFRTKGDCELAIRKDRIFSGWDDHAKNYMTTYDKDRKKNVVKAVDFRAWMPLENAKPEMLNPRYSQQLGNPDRCKYLE